MFKLQDVSSGERGDFTSSSEEGVCAFLVVGRTVVRQN